MHGIIQYMFDYWANPIVHLLLKSSMSMVNTDVALVKHLNKPTWTIWGLFRRAERSRIGCIV